AEPDDADSWIWAEPYWFDADCTLVVYVRENYDPVQRTGTLPIKSEAILRNVTVIQEGNPNPPEPEL
ncbi:MAG: BACON domain-containing protein, partial [Bacteroidales bacterium]|nr:BACON domain-containing protein [Bacteroidales bacterium]